MTVRKPSLHARDHLPGGADPLRINLATSKYSNEVINNPEGGLFLYWKLDELGNTTTVAVDSSGNGRAGTFDSDTGAAIDVGVLGLADDTCFTFHRSGHFGHNWDGGPNANVRWSGPYTPTAAISMECWIRTTQAGSSVGCFFNLSGGSTSSPLASLYLDTSGAATFELDSPGASHTVTGSSVVNDGTKHHIVATYDGATMNLYVDGALDGTLAMSLGMHTVSGTLVVVANGREIGSQSWDRGFTGTEDEFAFYTEALLPTTVDTHFLIGQTGTTSAPSGAAGGDMAGTYPDPTLAAIGSPAGPIGSTSVVPVVTIDAKGRVTALTSASPQIDTIGSGTNITTNDVSITKHGLAPKLPNDATKYLDGTGAYTTPGGGGGGGALDVQDYSAGATWTKPAGAHIVEVVILGSGGGGGGGFSSGFGGAGGGGGSVVRVVFKAADLGATEAVTVATGGSAGSGGGGSNGSAGTGSSAFHGVAAFNGGGGVGGGGFGNVQAGGGAGYAGNGAAASAGSPAASGSVGIAGQGGNPPSNSANGGAAESGGGSGAAAGASPFAGGCSLNAGPGGGSGGSGGGSNNGGAGGKSGSTGSGGGGAGGTGGASPTAGTAGANATGGFGGSGGGGGGSASGSGTAGKGGNGGPGGGGGGGGSSSGGTGGNGGTGGAGRVLVITY